MLLKRYLLVNIDGEVIKEYRSFEQAYYRAMLLNVINRLLLKKQRYSVDESLRSMATWKK